MIRFVTTNEGKFREVAAILRADGIEVERLDRSYPEVQADRLEDVVDHGVRALAATVEGDFFVDDSGLFVDALSGFPGVYSAYVFRTLGNAGILRLLQGAEARGARFETVIGVRLGGRTHVVRGEVRGTIAKEARGAHGFGYDPIFVPEGGTKTFAEISTEEKNAVSHRGRAARALADFLKGR